MTNETIIKLELNDSKINNLFDALDNKGFFIENKTDTAEFNRKKITYDVYNRICAAKERLKDTVEYVNSMELHVDNYLAFDFYNLINNLFVIKDCIQTFARIFKVETRVIEDCTNCFHMVGDGSGTDEDFFKYIRSLTIAHPLKTDRHAAYRGSSKFQCCPYVHWIGGKVKALVGKDNDLSVVIYGVGFNDDSNIIHLKLKDFEDYINKWLDLLPSIIDSINDDKTSYINEFINTPLKTVNDFNDYADYLSYIKDELVKRYNDENYFEIDFMMDVFKINPIDQNNLMLLNKYRNAIKYGMTFVHYSIQNMCIEESSNTGVTNSEKYLIDMITSPYGPNIYRNNWGYNVSKLYYLDDLNNWEEVEYAKELVYEMMPLLIQYVDFKEISNTMEMRVMVNVALYFDCLENDCLLNNSIPNNILYRRHL